MLTTKNTLELQAGDVVQSHGMRLLVETAPTGKGNRIGTVSTDALVLNPDEVKAAGHVPFSWLTRPDGQYRWTIQGSELARWTVEQQSPLGGTTENYSARTPEQQLDDDDAAHVARLRLQS